MKPWFLALGVVLIFIGLILISIASPVTIHYEDTQTIKEGNWNSTEVTDVFLNAGDKFSVKYSGGGTHVNPDDVIVTITEPNTTQTTVSYETSINGIIADATGMYNMSVGAPGLVDPSFPLMVRVEKITDKTRTEYPNLNWLPPGLALVIIGGGISIWSAKSPKRKAQSKTKRQRVVNTLRFEKPLSNISVQAGADEQKKHKNQSSHKLLIGAH